MPDCHLPVYCTIICVPFTPETEHFDAVITSLNVVVIERPVTVPVGIKLHCIWWDRQEYCGSSEDKDSGKFRVQRWCN